MRAPAGALFLAQLRCDGSERIALDDGDIPISASAEKSLVSIHKLVNYFSEKKQN